MAIDTLLAWKQYKSCHCFGLAPLTFLRMVFSLWFPRDCMWIRAHNCVVPAFLLLHSHCFVWDVVRKHLETVISSQCFRRSRKLHCPSMILSVSNEPHWLHHDTTESMGVFSLGLAVQSAAEHDPCSLTRFSFSPSTTKMFSTED